MTAEYKIIKEQEHFWRIENGGVRAFLLEGTEKAMLVDTGFGNIPMKAIVTGLTSLPVFVVNTHADRDHTGCNGEFDEIYMNPADKDRYIRNLPEGCDPEKVFPLSEGDIIDLGIWKFKVIFTPGHTPGSIMLFEREKRFLISGDSIQNGMMYMFGEGRNVSGLIASLEKIKAMSKDIQTIYPSHAKCPLTADIIPYVLTGAKALQAGELKGENPPFPVPAKLYSAENISFLYNEEEHKS